MVRIFISYSRKDEVFVRKLATFLSNRGAEIWLDIEDIPAGMNWSSAIQEGLDTCPLMILVISPDSMTSNNVSNEWQYHLDHDKQLIPVWWRPANCHFQLNRLEYIDFHQKDFDIATSQLLNELRQKGIILATPIDHNSNPLNIGSSFSEPLLPSDLKRSDEPQSEKPLPTHELLASVADMLEKQHTSFAQEQAEKEKRLTEQNEQRKIDIGQQRELIETLRSTISELNKRNGYGNITEASNLVFAQPNRDFAPSTRFDIPLNGSVDLVFFWIEPLLDLKVGQVRFAAFLGHSCGVSLNYLLCRSSITDTYGNWAVCRVKHHSWINPEKRRPRPEPFGFSAADEIHEIEKADKAMHVYENEFSSDIGGAFLQLILDAKRYQQ